MMNDSNDNPQDLKLQKSEFTTTPVVPFIALIITDRDGSVLGYVAGEDGHQGALAKHLSDSSQDEDDRVAKVNDSLTPLGQDTYIVTREFLVGSWSHIRNWENASSLAKILPQECVCTFVVNY